jgi:hypothetical protein
MAEDRGSTRDLQVAIPYVTIALSKRARPMETRVMIPILPTVTALATGELG